MKLGKLRNYVYRYMLMGGLLLCVKAAFARQWEAFPLTSVNLHQGTVFHQAMVHHLDYVLSLDVDRLLSFTRESCGLPPKARRYGGWEANGSITYGHYLSALSMYYAGTGNQTCLQKLQYTLSELSACSHAAEDRCVYPVLRRKGLQQILQEGRLALSFNYPAESDPTMQSWDFNGEGNMWYSLHKVLKGLYDAYTVAGQEQALQIAHPMLQQIARLCRKANPDLLQAMLAVEHGGISEVMALFYQLTGDESYALAAQRLTPSTLMYALCENRDVLVGRHANDQIPKFIGAQVESELGLGSSLHQAAHNFWDMVVNHHTLANGGNSCYERFGRPDEELFRIDTKCSETCNTYNMLRLSRLLFMEEGDAKYMHYYEWALYNHILASLDMCHSGGVCYYTALRSGEKKVFSTPYDSFWCCVGTGMENHAKYGESIYFHSDRDLMVSQYISSTLRWNEAGCRVSLDADLARHDTVTVRIEEKGRFDGRLLLRIPTWAKGSKVLGAKATREGDYWVLKHIRQGTVIRLVLPHSLYLRQVNGASDYHNLCYGPLLLSATLDDDEKWEPQPLVGDTDHLERWVTKVSDNLDFEVESKNHRWHFKPYYAVTHERLAVYWPVFSPLYYQRHILLHPDTVSCGDVASESRHALVYNHSTSGTFRNMWIDNQSYRCAENGGEFSYRLSLSPDIKSGWELACRYWCHSNESTVFSIFIDGELLVEVHQDQLPQLLSYTTQTYPIPERLTAGKSSILITFKSHESTTTGPIFSVGLQANEKTPTNISIQ